MGRFRTLAPSGSGTSSITSDLQAGLDAASPGITAENPPLTLGNLIIVADNTERPDPGIPGRLCYSFAERILYYDTGSVWFGGISPFGVYFSVASLEANADPLETTLAFCAETQTLYLFLEASPLTVDHLAVLSVNGYQDSRWFAAFGAYGQHCFIGDSEDIPFSGNIPGRILLDPVASRFAISDGLGNWVGPFAPEIDMSDLLLMLQPFVFNATTEPSSPEPDKASLYVTASGESPNRQVALKCKFEDGTEVTLASVLV
jgi:hypothetical protein